jgi:antitoxin component YwqK of YwqJK toxin-antitoxin module
VNERSVIWIIVSLALLAACTSGNKDTGNKGTGSDADGTRIVKEYHPDGSLKSETEAVGKLRQGISREYRKDGTLENLITYENNQKNGPARNYYSDGKTIKTEINYRNGYKQGEAKWYYPDGSIYRKTPYLKGKIHGNRLVYYDNGNLQAEIPYFEGQPGVGLKEYNQNGSLKKHDAHIVFQEQDKVQIDNTYKVFISLSDGDRKVSFYSGELTDGRFWNDMLSPIPTENGVGTLEYHVSLGTFKMETINVVARIITGLNNFYFLQHEYHLAVENKH